MFYKLLGMLVWNGAKVVLRQQVRTDLRPEAAPRGRRHRHRRRRRDPRVPPRQLRASARSRLAARFRPSLRARGLGSRRAVWDASGAHGRVVRHPAPAGPRDRGRRVAALGRRQRPRARARALEHVRRGPARAARAAAARRRGGASLRVAARRPLRPRPRVLARLLPRAGHARGRRRPRRCGSSGPAACAPACPPPAPRARLAAPAAAPSRPRRSPAAR